MSELLHLDKAKHRRIPRPLAYPSDYGLANAAHQLLAEYGKDGAINRLIEMAERLRAGQDPLAWALRRQRVEPPCYNRSRP